MSAATGLAVQARTEVLEKYLKYVKWVAIVASIALAAWLDRSHLGQTVHDLFRLSVILFVILAVCEVFYFGGAGMMIVGFGLRLWQTLKEVFEKRSPKVIFERVEHIKPNRLVWLGHYTNMTAATIQGLTLIVAGLLVVPSSFRGGIVVLGVADLALTAIRCVPQQSLMNAAAGKLRVTGPKKSDLPLYAAAQHHSWDKIGMAASEAMLEHRIAVLGENLYVVRKPRGEPVGFLTTLILSEYDTELLKTWGETTADGWCDTHDPEGSIVFGADMSRVPKFSGDVHKPLMLAFMAKAIKRDRVYAQWGSRLPLYYRHADTMTAEEYVNTKTPSGRVRDPEVRIFLDGPGVRVIKVIPDYFPDPPSLNYGVLLRWDNPFCSRTNRRWWRFLASNQLARNILAWIIPRAAAVTWASGGRRT